MKNRVQLKLQLPCHYLLLCVSVCSALVVVPAVFTVLQCAQLVVCSAVLGFVLQTWLRRSDCKSIVLTVLQERLHWVAEQQLHAFWSTSSN